MWISGDFWHVWAMQDLLLVALVSLGHLGPPAPSHCVFSHFWQLTTDASVVQETGYRGKWWIKTTWAHCPTWLVSILLSLCNATCPDEVDPWYLERCPAAGSAWTFLNTLTSNKILLNARLNGLFGAAFYPHCVVHISYIYIYDYLYTVYIYICTVYIYIIQLIRVVLCCTNVVLVQRHLMEHAAELGKGWSLGSMWWRAAVGHPVIHRKLGD